MQGQQQFPVVEVDHAGVDRVDAHEFSVGLELGENGDYGLREVVIEGEQARHRGRLLGGDERAKVPGELPFEVEGVVDRSHVDLRVQPVNLRCGKAALRKSADRLRL